MATIDDRLFALFGGMQLSHFDDDELITLLSAAQHAFDLLLVECELRELLHVTQDGVPNIPFRPR